MNDSRSFPRTTAAIDTLGRAIVDLYRDRLAADGNMNSDLFRTITCRVSSGGRGWVISISLEEYWKYIEYGRKPGKMPPLDSIRGWISRKPVMPHSITLKNGRTTMPTVPQLAYLIARKIGRDGIDPKPFFRQSLEQAEKLYIDAIREALKADVADMMKGDK